MKGVFIPGMEMPRGCLECPMLSHWRCRPMDEDIPDETGIGDRPDWCPLQEVELPDSETVTSLIDYYDKVETHENCTVEVLTNTKTGAISVGWWRNEDEC